MTRQWHDALVTQLALLGLDGHRQSTLLADQPAEHLRRQRCRRAIALRAGQGPVAEVMRALCNEQPDGAIALQLQRQRALEFERGGEQQRGAYGLAQQLLHWRRIFAELAQVTPALANADPLAAHGAAIKNEALHLFRCAKFR